MGRRPVCVLCLLFMVFLCLADWLGIPLIRGNPLPAELEARIKEASEISAIGEVERCTDTEISQSVYLKDVSVIFHSKKISIGNLRVFLKKKEKLPAGSLILVRGILEEVEKPRNPGEFDSQVYYRCRHIYYLMKKALVVKRSKGYSVYGQFLLELQKKLAVVLDQVAGSSAPVFRAIVLGDKGELEPETKMRYQMAGIIHILAISGLHISVLGVGLYKLFMAAGLGIWISGLAALVVMVSYGMMTGGSVSTMRALIMFLLSVGAKILGRIYDMPTALSVAVILILSVSPSYIREGGFWLSFGAVAGIGVVAPVFLDIFKVKGKAGKAFLASLAVQMTTLPVMLWFYGEVSLAGVFLNLMVLPTVGIVLGSGVAAALAGLGWMSAARLLIFPGRGLLWLYELVCGFAEKLPLCSWVAGQPKPWQMVVYYLVLMGILVALRRRWIVALLMVLNTGLLAGRGTSGFRITCLDIGQGDGIVLELPSGQNFLIDGGSSNKKGICQYQILPYLKNRGISFVDAVFISHTDGDHISGIKEFLEFQALGAVSVKIGSLVLPMWEKPPEAWLELTALAKAAEIPVFEVKEGDSFSMEEAEFRILAPFEGTLGENVNEEGMVMELSYGEFLGLFTGDIGMETEEKLLEKELLRDIDYLKVGHHGSKHSSGEEFLEKLRPEVAVISASESNTYGHPSPEAIQRLEAAGARVFCTKDKGAVITEVDKNRKNMKVQGYYEEE